MRNLSRTSFTHVICMRGNRPGWPSRISLRTTRCWMHTGRCLLPSSRAGDSRLSSASSLASFAPTLARIGPGPNERTAWRSSQHFRMNESSDLLGGATSSRRSSIATFATETRDPLFQSGRVSAGPSGPSRPPTLQYRFRSTGRLAVAISPCWLQLPGKPSSISSMWRRSGLPTTTGTDNATSSNIRSRALLPLPPSC